MEPSDSSSSKLSKIVTEKLKFIYKKNDSIPNIQQSIRVAGSRKLKLLT